MMNMSLYDIWTWLLFWPRYYWRTLVRRPVAVYYVTTVDAIPDGQQGQIARDEDPGHLPLLETRIGNLEVIPTMDAAEHDKFGAIILVSYNQVEMFGLWQSEGVQALRSDGQWDQ